MVVIDELTENNLILFAAQNYRKPNFSDIEEFYEDLNRFKYIKRLLNRYIESGKLAERLILNHVIVIFNAFDVNPTLKMLEYKLNDEQWKVIKPFLVFLRHIKNDEYIKVPMDKNVVEALRKI